MRLAHRIGKMRAADEHRWGADTTEGSSAGRNRPIGPRRRARIVRRSPAQRVDAADASASRDQRCRAIAPLPAAARQRSDAPGELERHQSGGDRFGRRARARDERVDVDRIIAHRREHRTRRRVGGRSRAGGVGTAASACADPQLVEHVLRGFDELRAFADQLVAAFRERRMNRAGNREDLAALLARPGAR